MIVLIVDDDPEFRMSVKRLLEQVADLSTVEASDGEEAVRLAFERVVDLVLIDITLPRLDGLEATRRIKAERPETKVVMLTVHDEAAYRRAAAEQGADGFIVKKNFEPALLFAPDGSCRVGAR